jgi:hypothetical protein
MTLVLEDRVLKPGLLRADNYKIEIDPCPDIH